MQTKDGDLNINYTIGFLQFLLALLFSLDAFTYRMTNVIPFTVGTTMKY